MLPYLRACRVAQRVVKARKASLPSNNKKLVLSRFVHPVSATRLCSQTVEVTASSLSKETPIVSHVEPLVLAKSRKVEEDINKVQEVLNLAGRNDRKVHTEQVFEVAEKLELILTPAVLKSIHSLLQSTNETIETLVADIAIVFFRVGQSETANRIIVSVSPKRRLNAIFSYCWSQFVKAEIWRDGEVASVISGREMAGKGRTESFYLSTYSSAGSPGALATISASVSSAIQKHDVAPSTTALVALMLLTLRMIPADLKSVRQQVVRLDAPKTQVDQWKADAESAEPPASPASDLIPSSSSGFLPSLQSAFDMGSPPIRRPIPLEKSHYIAKDSLGPIWELLQTELDNLTLPQLHTLAIAFNKATLVQASLKLVPALEKYSKADNKDTNGPTRKTLFATYSAIIDTLCDDIQYDEVYRIYKWQLFVKSTGTYKQQLSQHPKLVSALLQGVSRASNATYAEKEALYQLAMSLKFITADALVSYCYALARTVEVTAMQLFEVYEQNIGHKFHKHNLRYMNEIFYGLSMRGSFQLAYQVLCEMWERGGTISASAIDLFLERCISARQTHLVADILNLMRPQHPVQLREGKKNVTTSKNLPLLLPLKQIRYQSLFSLYARSNLVEEFKQALTDYSATDQYAPDRHFLRKLLQICRRASSVPCVEAVIAWAKSLDLPLTIFEINEILTTFNKAQDFPRFTQLFDSITSTLHLTPDERTYASKVHAMKHSTNPNQAIDVLDEMNDVGITPTNIIFEALMSVLAPTSTERAEWILQHMSTVNVEPSLRIYKHLLKAYATEGNLAMFQQHLNYATQSTGLPLTQEFCQALAECFSVLKQYDTIVDWLLPLMKREKLDVKDFEFVSVLVVSMYRMEYDQAAEEQILGLPNLKSLQTNARDVDSLFIPALRILTSHSLDRAKRLLNFMHTRCGIPIGHELYATIIEELDRQQNMEEKQNALTWMESQMHAKEFAALKDMLQLGFN